MARTLASSSPAVREYTPRQQEASSSAPVFDDDARVKVRSAFGKYTVSVPAAKSTDGRIVFVYRVRVTDGDGHEKSTQYLVNDYWHANMYKTVTFRVDAEKGDIVSVTAENAYGLCSQPLRATV